MTINLTSRRSTFALSLIVAAFVAGTTFAARAANIVQNPGFEDDAVLLQSVCGGTIPNGPGCLVVSQWNIGGNAGEELGSPNSGAVDAFVETGTLAQDLTTIAGATYSITFQLAAEQSTLDNAVASLLGTGGEDATLDASFGSDDLGSVDAIGDFLLAGVSANQYVQESFIDIAAGTTTTLAFTGSNDNGVWNIDDVDVECTANCVPVTAVPEPSSLWLLLAGLGIAAAAGRALRHEQR